MRSARAMPAKVKPALKAVSLTKVESDWGLLITEIYRPMGLST
jgi:hypothetical protein